MPKCPKYPKCKGFDAKLDAFINGCKGRIKAYYDQDFPSLTPPEVKQDSGVRYIRIYHIVITNETMRTTQLIIFAFVEKTTGLIFKPAGWRSTAKHPSGNIFSPTGGLEAVSPSGSRIA